eukprot:CAMPEP_0173340082 /NCGR_PEP_ID=MMETSP1144-20121109/8770_1 /TAXON_ID=483371 /ORGANISM="non described non described, Strain CCMP2298" /LENGTH=173 /DNA_ID=CAMNT_0014286157 /DNA_START=811 /DNA_END=1332 /DNA_ORIENTATION=+
MSLLSARRAPRATSTRRCLRGASRARQRRTVAVSASACCTAPCSPASAQRSSTPQRTCAAPLSSPRLCLPPAEASCQRARKPRARAHEGRTSANARASAALHSAKSFKWRSAQPSSRDVPQPLPSRQARLCACERWAAARNKPMQSASLRRALADSAPLLTGDRLAKPRQVRR